MLAIRRFEVLPADSMAPIKDGGHSLRVGQVVAEPQVVTVSAGQFRLPTSIDQRFDAPDGGANKVVAQLPPRLDVVKHLELFFGVVAVRNYLEHRVVGDREMAEIPGL